METKQTKTFVNPNAVYKAVEARATAQADEAQANLEASRQRLATSGVHPQSAVLLERQHQEWAGWTIERAATELLKAAGKL